MVNSHLEEVKSTSKDSFVLKVEDIHKIMDRARMLGRQERFVIDFTKHDLKLVIELD